MSASQTTPTQTAPALLASAPQTRVVVVGAGYAGLLFTTRLADKVAGRNVQITLVNESPAFTERLRLHQYATNQRLAWRPIAEMLRGTHVRFVRAIANPDKLRWI